MDFLIQVTPQMIAIVALVVGVTQVIKPFVSDQRFYPIISLVFGIAFSFLVPQISIPMTILAGLVMGLSASGVYSTGKTLTKQQ